MWDSAAVKPVAAFDNYGRKTQAGLNSKSVSLMGDLELCVERVTSPAIRFINAVHTM